MTSTANGKASIDPRSRDRVLEAAMLALILVPALAAALYYVWAWEKSQDWLRVIAVIVLSLFFPLLAYSFYFFRKERRKVELERIVSKLGLEGETNYMEMFTDIRTGPYFCLASGIAWLVALSGLLILFLGDKIGIDTLTPFEFGEKKDQKFPAPGSRLIFGMAFLGAYFWGVQYAFRRYVLNDLIPGVFYSLAIRMLLASTIALLVFNTFASPVGGGPEGAEIKIGWWPALAFLIGTFPQRGLLMLTERVPGFSTQTNPSVRALPVDMIEGIGPYDKMRLQELGIETCHDLATADFIPLVLKTSYGAREVLDWLLQAKLCVYCGQAVGDLRQHGIRDILDLAALDDDQISKLALNTSASEISLLRARDLVTKNRELDRLKAVAAKLGEYTPVGEGGEPPADAEPKDDPPA